jgi:cobyrinic acid a,c-diamide synthase
MGLFDGSGSGPHASTAHVARLLDAPVVLVVDAAAMSGSVAAVVHGFRTLDPAVRVAGVVLNRVGSDGHEILLRDALAPLGLPVLGALRRDDRVGWRDRHLGLVPVAERPGEVRAALAVLAELVAARIDLDAVVALGRTAAPLAAGEIPTPPPGEGRAAVALAGGPAFSFTYPELPEALAAAGADVVPFDPRHDAALPAEATGLIAGGGFPEVFAAELAANEPLLADVRRRVGDGLATWAECGGLLWLARSLDGRRLAGVVPADGRMTDRVTLGYRNARTRAPSPLGPAGTALQGHEFRYSDLDPPGDALHLEGRFGTGLAGFATPTLLATYLHVHPAGEPAAISAFVRSASRPRHPA